MTKTSPIILIHLKKEKFDVLYNKIGNDIRNPTNVVRAMNIPTKNTIA